jgi:outer membrane protein TolC
MIKKSGIILFFIFWGSIASATEVSDYVQRILEVDIDLQQSKAQWQAAKSNVKSGYATAMPELNLFGQSSTSKKPASYGGSLFPSKSYTVGLSVSQPIYLGGRVWNTIRIRKELATQAEYLFGFAQQKALISALGQLVQLDSLIQKVKNIRQSQDIQKNLLDVTIRKSKRGNARSYEVHQAYADYYSYGPRIELLNNQILEAKESLSERLKWPMDKIYSQSIVKQLVQVTKNSEKFKSMTVKQALQNSYKSRADYLAQAQSLKIAKTQKKINFGSHLPTVQLSGSWGYLSNNTSQLIESSSRNETYGLDISIPLFSGLSSFHDRKSDEMKIFVQTKKNEALRQSIKVQLLKYLDLYQRSIKTLDQTQKWKSSAQKALVSGEKNFKSGFIQQVQMVQLQVGFERAFGAHIDARSQLINSYVNLAFQLGEDLVGQLK